MTYIKLLTVLAGLALLTACGGAAAPDNTDNTGEGNINNGNPCDTNPFGDDCGADYDAAKVTRIRECLKGNNAASTSLCAPAIKVYSCIDDPFTVACSNNSEFAVYLNDARTMRTTYCEANPDETAFCAESVTFNNVCKDNPDIFNEVCFPAENPRRDACLGDVLDTLSDPSCATRPSVVSVCTDDPFTRTGCANVRTIGDLRTMYCGDKTTAWHDDCVEATYSVATDARNMACLDYGIDATKGGNALCSARQNVLDACDMDTPFAHPVCNEVANIDRDIRTPFCQMPANAFTTGCEQTKHGDVDTARDTACLLDLSADTGCPERPNVKSTCVSEPLPEQNAGCKNLSNYGMLLSDFCAMENNAVTYLSGGCGTTAAAVCPNNLFNPSAIIVGGTIDCLGDATFAPARLTACATEAELDDCDTTEIAPEVCKDSGANANPFAAFCETATNRGGDKTVAEIRQSALDACPDDTKDGEVGICKNTIMTRATLNMECVLIADAFKPQCAYTQFNDERMGFCNDQSTAWDTGCDGETTYAGTTAMRDAACLADKTADMGYTGSDTRCGMRTGVATACGIADPFAHVGCDNVANIDSEVRTPYCQTPATAWKPRCMEGMHGMVNATRVMACQMFGTSTNMGGDDSCAGSLASSCTLTDPFMYTGCKDVVGIAGVRMMYCQAPATAWDEACMDGMHGTVDTARVMACQMFGTSTNMGGDDSCATSLAPSCTITDPFMYTGCKDVAGIAGVRMMYCQAPATAWDEACMDGMHGMVTATRGEACLKFGIDTNVGGHATCIDNSLAESSCEANPFDPMNRGCAILTEFPMIVEKYCRDTMPDADGCAAKYSTWTDSFSAAPLATAPVNRGGNIEVGFLSGLTKTQPTITGFTSNSNSYASATLADHNLGGDTNNGFAIWFGSWDGNVTNHYSGILTTTNVGTPLNNAKQDGTWRGRILAFNSVDDGIHKDFTFTVNFDAKKIYAFVASSGNSTFYEIEGRFEGGLLSGSVEYGQDNGGGSANGTLESGDGLYVDGTLTGLIGADGAVGAFIGKTVDIGFSGGFVAIPPPPPMPNHATFKTYYADSARTASGRRLYPTPTTTTVTSAFVEGTATSLPTDGLTFTADNTFAPITVRLGEAVSGDDGFAIMYGVTTDGSNGIYRAGLLSMTDLGPALDNTIATSWSGTIYSSINLTSGVPASIPLDLTVNFTDGEINTTTPATHGTSTITVKGRFGSAHGLDDGILGGTVDYNVANSLQAPALPLIGLIGTEGVIGVFHGAGKLTAVGGFQASPN